MDYGVTSPTTRKGPIAVLKCGEERRYLRQSKVKVGRSNNADLFLDGKTISHNHAVLEIFPHSKHAILHDLNSRNGCFVNGTLIQNTSCAVNEGDRIRFGYDKTTYEFSFFLSGKDDETKKKKTTQLIHNDTEGSLPSVRKSQEELETKFSKVKPWKNKRLKTSKVNDHHTLYFPSSDGNQQISFRDNEILNANVVVDEEEDTKRSSIGEVITNRSLSKTRLENERIAFEQRVAAAEERRKAREAEQAELRNFTKRKEQEEETFVEKEEEMDTPRRDTDDIIAERLELENRIRTLNHELAASNLRTQSETVLEDDDNDDESFVSDEIVPLPPPKEGLKDDDDDDDSVERKMRMNGSIRLATRVLVQTLQNARCRVLLEAFERWFETNTTTSDRDRTIQSILVQRMIDAISRPIRRRLREYLDVWIERDVRIRRELQRKIACEKLLNVSNKIFRKMRSEALTKWHLSARMNTELAKHRGRLMRRLLQRKCRDMTRISLSRWCAVRSCSLSLSLTHTHTHTHTQVTSVLAEIERRKRSLELFRALRILKRFADQRRDAAFWRWREFARTRTSEIELRNSTTNLNRIFQRQTGARQIAMILIRRARHKLAVRFTKWYRDSYWITTYLRIRKLERLNEILQDREKISLLSRFRMWSRGCRDLHVRDRTRAVSIVSQTLEMWRRRKLSIGFSKWKILRNQERARGVSLIVSLICHKRKRLLRAAMRALSQCVSNRVLLRRVAESSARRWKRNVLGVWHCEASRITRSRGLYKGVRVLMRFANRT